MCASAPPGPSKDVSDLADLVLQAQSATTRNSKEKGKGVCLLLACSCTAKSLLQELAISRFVLLRQAAQTQLCVKHVFIVGAL